MIIDPIGAALVFHSLIPEGEKNHRRIMAVKSILISVFLLIVFGNYGEPLLDQLGININSLRIAGGLLLFYTAFNMITEAVEYEDTMHKKDISVFPMTIPLLAGPGDTHVIHSSIFQRFRSVRQPISYCSYSFYFTAYLYFDAYI